MFFSCVMVRLFFPFLAKIGLQPALAAPGKHSHEMPSRAKPTKSSPEQSEPPIAAPIGTRDDRAKSIRATFARPVLQSWLMPPPEPMKKSWATVSWKKFSASAGFPDGHEPSRGCGDPIWL